MEESKGKTETHKGQLGLKIRTHVCLSLPLIWMIDMTSSRRWQTTKETYMNIIQIRKC